MAGMMCHSAPSTTKRGIATPPFVRLAGRSNGASKGAIIGGFSARAALTAWL